LYYKYLDHEADERNEPILDEIHDEFEDDLHEIADDFNLDELKWENQYLVDTVEGKHPWSFAEAIKFVKSYRWFINILLVGVPWFLWSSSMLGWNIFMNVI
jgi:hypothetical protein